MPLDRPQRAVPAIADNLAAVLAMVATAAIVIQAYGWLRGEPGNLEAVVILCGAILMFGTAAAQHRRGRRRWASVATSATLLLLVPAFSFSHTAEHVLTLVPAVSFLLSLPYLRGTAMVAFGGLCTAVSVAAALHPVLMDPATRSPATGVDVATVGLASSAVTLVLLGLAWHLRRRAEAANARYAEVVASVPIGISRTTPDGRLLEVNPAYVAMLGYPDAATLLATRVQQLVAEPAAIESWNAALLERGQVAGETELRRYDGRGIWVRFATRATLADDGRIAWSDSAVQDITAEQSDALAKARLAAVVDAAGDAVIALGPGLEIEAWNPAAQRIYGWSSEEIVGHHVAELVPAADRAKVESARQTALAEGRVGPVEFGTLTKSGTVGVISVVAARIADATGEVAGFSVTARDVTEARAVEAERARLEERLREAEKLEAVGRLAGGVAHDFNNLLTAILGHADILRDDALVPEERRASAEAVTHAASRAADITRQLLAFARKQVVEAAAIDLVALVRETEPLLRPALGELVHLEFRLGCAPITVRGDRTQLTQVLMNLVLNARDAMPMGGTITIEVEQTSADVPDTAVAAPARLARLSVTDRGPGIPDNVLPHVFEPFFTTKEVGRGTGLGLASVHGIVAQAGGQTEVVTSRAGTTITIVLPLEDTAPELLDEVSTLHHPAAGELILVVDDQPVVRAIAAQILRREGYRVEEAGGGEAALAAAAREPPAAVLTDVVMPGMRGPDLAQRLRERHPDVRVLFMSGYTDQDPGSDGRPLEPLVSKPFSADLLVSEVGRLLSDRPTVIGRA